MKQLAQTPLSVLDLVNFPQGKTVADAFQRTRELAQHTEALGYQRYWMAEHHNLAGIASSATPILIGYVAENTKTIRVGSGGIMLPNHSPMVVAEQFGTLATLYPGRIDLGLGRAPGTDPLTSRALRRDLTTRAADFGELIGELGYFLAPAEDGQKLKAIPGAGIDIPLWILGSSLYSAELAARLGRPYAFAGHFAPAQLLEALQIYRARFQPSRHLARPHTMVGVAAVAADDDAHAQFLSTSSRQRILSLIRGNLKQTPPPVKTMDGLWSPEEEAAVHSMTRAMIVGGPKTVRRGLQELIDHTQADELIIMSDLFDDADRLCSYTILADVKR